MDTTKLYSALNTLKSQLEGELQTDDLIRAIYATDASVYRMKPLAVVFPKSILDLKLLIAFGIDHNTSLIPRTAGTSLAGQCVGKGIVVDVSKYFTKILDINEKQRTVTVQPGVVRDELNNYLKPFGLFFGPNTSTSNRCMIGGMVGNNSSGTTSIKYGVTRDKVIRLKTLISDGSEVVFESLNAKEFQNKLEQSDLEGHIYKTLHKDLSVKENQARIKKEFPKASIHRRNNGYAIDAIVDSNIYTKHGCDFNMCKLLSGSEGTLALTTEITLQLDELPPKNSVMVAAHFISISNCMNAVELVMSHDLYTCEMMDKTILDLTKHNKQQQENRKFVVNDPMAILMCELRAEKSSDAIMQAQKLVTDLENSGLSFANPILVGEEIDSAMELRKAGLGLLGNLIGDEKSAACIEDTAVALSDLAAYISDFSKLMEGHGQKPVYYAHAGAGELHLRPILNLKKKTGVENFRKITTDVAKLVKSYGGSMSGEHGDGIVRSEFIPLMIGRENYEILVRIKHAFDPNGIFNSGKIVESYAMDQSLRYEPGRKEPVIETIMDFSESLGILREAEKCNGSGDCRKLPEFGGTMCPSYRATLDEKDTTRARANALREFLTHSDKQNKFDHDQLKEVFDLCLSCKACGTECPSSVDVASLKAEFQYQYQKANGRSLSSQLFAYNHSINELASHFPRLTNWMFSNSFLSTFIKKNAGIAIKRTLPHISKISLSKYYKRFENHKLKEDSIKTIYLFNDEFTNHLDTEIGIDALELLKALNYDVKILKNVESGRALISRGFLDEARKKANYNIKIFKDIISASTPLIGIEPSAILTFKDEYLKLADNKEAAICLGKNVFLIEEFIQNEVRIGNIKSNQFTTNTKKIKFHGHCHQKALVNQKSSFDILNLPKNYKVTIIPSGCCGMAGSFGYEKEHYEVSMKIGEQTLFPHIRKTDDCVIISANGTSCRHQIKDGTSRTALHPISILRAALL